MKVLSFGRGLAWMLLLLLPATRTLAYGGASFGPMMVPGYGYLYPYGGLAMPSPIPSLPPTPVWWPIMPTAVPTVPPIPTMPPMPTPVPTLALAPGISPTNIPTLVPLPLPVDPSSAPQHAASAIPFPSPNFTPSVGKTPSFFHSESPSALSFATPFPEKSPANFDSRRRDAGISPPIPNTSGVTIPPLPSWYPGATAYRGDEQQQVPWSQIGSLSRRMEVYQAQIENILVSHHGKWEDLSVSEKDQCDVILARWTRVDRKMENLLARSAATVK